MAIQELYNKLRLKREYAHNDVALRLTTHELETLMFGLSEIGADVEAGYQHVLDFKETQNKKTEEDEEFQSFIKERLDHD